MDADNSSAVGWDPARFERRPTTPYSLAAKRVGRRGEAPLVPPDAVLATLGQANTRPQLEHPQPPPPVPQPPDSFSTTTSPVAETG